MALSPVMRMQLVNATERVLHAPGNTSHDLSEMTVVLDYHMKEDEINQLAKDLAGALKSHSQVFSNVRLNVVHWKGDEAMDNQVTALALLQLGRVFDGYTQIEKEKDLTSLCQKLKKFHARSKLIWVFTDFAYYISDNSLLREALSPFIKERILLTDGKRIESGKEIFLKSLS